ncbi:MAG TPA: N-6 DNA methylase [Gemmatimonadaceae bacterium]|nr:N-6 DNA methylase [Gemmatimonadaceae bacterium]
MHTIRSAAALLAAARDLGALGELATFSGFAPALETFDADGRRALGLPVEFRVARIACLSPISHGACRALLIESDGSRPLRESLGRLASRLASRAPHVCWLVFARARGQPDFAIAAWDVGRTSPAIRALMVDPAHVRDSDAETLCALEAARAETDILTHARWLDVLGRDAICRRFFRALEAAVARLALGAVGRADHDARAELALLNVSRLLFLSFLEAMGWLDGDRAWLGRRFDSCMATGGRWQERVLRPLFFGTLNTPVPRRSPAAAALGRIPFLNGGLFTRTAIESRHARLTFRDEDFGALFGEVLGRYRFTAREESASWSDAAIDPEMLGRAFESLMSSRDRRSSGAFYTPQVLVERVTRDALVHGLAATQVRPADVERVLDGVAPEPRVRDALRMRLAGFRILDPACGSGAFLVHALELLSNLARTLGDPRPGTEIRRAALGGSIFGVDVNPTAVWLCELRLWLAMILESEERNPERVVPLPNLDHNIRIGDALAGEVNSPAAGATTRGAVLPADAPLGMLRASYSRSVGARKRTLHDALEREERKRALDSCARALRSVRADRRELLLALRGRDLFGDRRVPARAERSAMTALRTRTRELMQEQATLRDGGALPFRFETQFADVMAAGGFDLVIGNPPWVRLHRIPPGARTQLRSRFLVYRQAAWRSGAEGAQAGAGFAAQVDLSALFIERALAVARPQGHVALIVPSKLWHSLAGGGVRQLLLERAQVRALTDWSSDSHLFAAAVYPSTLIAQRTAPEESVERMCRVTIAHSCGAVAWDTAHRSLGFDESPGTPWLLVPPDVRRAFDRLTAVGVPLSQGTFASPRLGVKCGLNDAFLVDELARERKLSRIRSGERHGMVESSLLRPALRGQHLTPWCSNASFRHIILAHGVDGRPLASLPPHAHAWLAPSRARLAARSDARGARRWWSVFRLDSAASDRPRVVWADVSRRPRAAFVPRGDPLVPLNSCYVVHGNSDDDALALVAILNSDIAAAWLELVSEPARGGYRRYLGWTMALLPLPSDWRRACEILVPLARRALDGAPPDAAELLDATLAAYRLRTSSVAPLLAWNAG